MKIQLSIFLVLQMAIQTFASSMLDHEIFQRKLFSEERDLTEAYGTNYFADSQNTYYDPYQMSWRFLGHFVKCGYPSDSRACITSTSVWTESRGSALYMEAR